MTQPNSALVKRLREHALSYDIRYSTLGDDLRSAAEALERLTEERNAAKRASFTLRFERDQSREQVATLSKQLAEAEGALTMRANDIHALTEDHARLWSIMKRAESCLPTVQNTLARDKLREAIEALPNRLRERTPIEHAARAGQKEEET